VPVAVVRGVPADWLGTGSIADDMIRPPADDLFR
jgi:F420-0:gamma-glutamyl ligase